MIKAVVGVMVICWGLMPGLAQAAPASGGLVSAQVVVPDGGQDGGQDGGPRGGQVILAAGGPFEGMEAVVSLEPPHLLALGLGIVGGATVISPALGVGEVIGVGLGVLGAEYLYRTYFERRGLFNLW